MSNNNHHHVMGSISEDKKLKVYEQVQGIDRISGLPDSILGKILSILPTKTAAATTILSTRWKNLFPFQVWPIYLAFDDTHLLHNTNSRSPVSYLSFFRDFVDKLLFNKTLIVADSMLLRCRRRNNSYNSHGDAKILSWVRAAALRLKVQHLSLEFCLYLDDHQPLFDILNGCSTLVSLTLGLDIELFLPHNFTLPNLKRLKLSEMVFDDEEGLCITKLLIGCPALEEFSMTRCSILLQFISINSPLLKSLTISESLSSYTSVCYVDIVAPNLQVLMFNCFAARRYCLSSFNSLISAHIDIGPTMEQVPNRYRPYLLDCDFDDEGAWFVYKGAANLVTACSNTVNLYLAARSIDALHHSSVLLPAFLNLTWLSLGSLGCHGWALLARLLHSSPYLKRLTFEGVFEKNKGSYADLQCLVSSPAKCLGLHVRKIEFRVFDCKVEETTLLKYFLKNGKVLEKVILSCLPRHIERLPMLRGHPKIVLEPR